MTENTEEENILKSSRFLKLFDLSTLSLVDLHFQKVQIYQGGSAQIN